MPETVVEVILRDMDISGNRSENGPHCSIVIENIEERCPGSDILLTIMRTPPERTDGRVFSFATIGVIVVPQKRSIERDTILRHFN